MTNIKQLIKPSVILFLYFCSLLLLFFFSFFFSFILSFFFVDDILLYFSSIFNYTFNKKPGFWLVNSRRIFRVISYLGLISFIVTAAGVFAWGFNFFTLWAVVFANYFTVLPSRASNRQFHSEYFLFTFICKVTWLIKFETRKCSDVSLKYSRKQQTKGIIYLASVLRAREIVRLSAGIFRKYSSQSWYNCS